MIQYSQEELHSLVCGYMETQTELIEKAKERVAVWKYADSEMFGFFPLFDFISFRGSQSWTANQGQWLDEKPDGMFYRHGLDCDGRVQLIERHNGIVNLFLRLDGFLDRVSFGGRANSLERFAVEDGHTVACYDYNLDPHQYSLELFDYANECCISSTRSSWYLSHRTGQWEASKRIVRCTFEHDERGLRRAYRDNGTRTGGVELMYERTG